MEVNRVNFWHMEVNRAFLTWAVSEVPLFSARFQGQPLYKLKPRKFRAAIEEAFLAERGFFELQMGWGVLAGEVYL